MNRGGSGIFPWAAERSFGGWSAWGFQATWSKQLRWGKGECFSFPER